MVLMTFLEEGIQYYVRRITFQCLQADYINTDMSYVYAI